jgi:predicted PurR-regulated permease PerM
MLSLALWGSIWGIAGMFLSVPFTVILMIIFSEFSKTKPIAIILSQNGKISTPEK